MKGELNIEKVERCMAWLNSGEAWTHAQSVNFLIDKMGELSVSLAYVNGQMVLAKHALNQRKVQAYNSLVGSSVANETYFAPSLAKDYVASKCAQEQYNYDICERTSRTIVHQIDALRTAISALKAEAQYVQR